jgi:hypothetical protein
MSLLFTEKNRAIKTGTDMRYSLSNKTAASKQHSRGYDESPSGGKMNPTTLLKWEVVLNAKLHYF